MRDDPAIIVGPAAFGAGYSLDYDPAAQTFGVRESYGMLRETFSRAERDPATPANVFRYAKSNNDVLLLTQPVAGGTGVRYFRALDYYTDTRTDGGPFEWVELAGSPILSADLPTRGSVTYTRTGVSGVAIITPNGGTGMRYSLGNSTMTLTIDFGAQKITSQLTLVGTAQGGADVPLATLYVTSDFAGNSTITYGSNDFVTDKQSFVGALFGPQADEAGSVFSLYGTDKAGTRSLRLIGIGAAAR